MIGSAACLSSTVPQAPLSPFRTPGIRLVHPCAGDAPPPVLTPHKAGDDVPAKRVLVVEDDAAAALELQQLLRECGYRVVGPAPSAEEARRLVDRGRPLHCAFLGACLPGAAGLADALTGRDVPVVWIAPAASDAFSWDRRDEPVVRQPFGRRELLEAIGRSTRTVAGRHLYTTPPPQPVWPRIFPQL